MAPRTSALVERFRALDAQLGVALARRLGRFFASQGQRALERVLLAVPSAQWDWSQARAEGAPAAPPSAEEVLPDQERQLLWLALVPFLLQATVNAGSLAGDVVGLEALLEGDARVAELMRDAGTRISGMHQTTLDAVRTTLADGVSRGYSARQIAYGVPEDDFRGLRAVVTETYRGRAQTIARTEIATARQHAALERYQEARLEQVYVQDGTECGWLHHDDDDKANGTWRTLIDARAHPIAHPNCVRQFLPGPPRKPRRLRITVEVSRGN